MNHRLQQTLLLLVLTIMAAYAAMMGFRHVDVVRGYFDARAGQVAAMYLGIIGFLAALAVGRPKTHPIAFGFLAGSQLCLGVLLGVINIYPMNPVTVFVLTLPVGAMGAVLGRRRARQV